MPSKFIAQLLEAGVVRVCYGSYWFCDETSEEMQVYTHSGEPLDLAYPLWEPLQALVAQRLKDYSYGYGWMTWDLERDVVVEGGHTEDCGDAGSRLGELYTDQTLLLEAASDLLTRGEAFFRTLLSSPEPLVRRALAQNVHLSLELLEPLLCDPDWHVQENLAQHSFAPELALRREQMQRDLERARDLLALPRDLTSLVYSPWWTVRAALAANPSSPSTVLKLLQDDPHEAVRLALATQPDMSPQWTGQVLEPYWDFSGPKQQRLLAYVVLPIQLLEHWAKSPDFTGYAHPCVPETVVLRSFGEVHLGFGFWSGQPKLSVPETARDTFNRLEPSQTNSFLRNCERARQSSDLAEQFALARSQWTRVRAEFALNPHAASSVLSELNADPHPTVRRAVLCNPATPLEWLEAALEQPSESELPYLLTNPALPWTRLKPFDTPEQRRFLAVNPNTPPSTLEVWYEDYGLRHIILRNPTVPLSVQWAVLEQAQPYALAGNFLFEKRLTWPEVLASPPQRQLSVQNDLHLCSLARSSGARPAILNMIWERFGWPMAEHLLANPALEPGLVQTIFEEMTEQGRLALVLPLLHAHPHAPEHLPPPARPAQPWWSDYLSDEARQHFEQDFSTHLEKALSEPEQALEWIEPDAPLPDWDGAQDEPLEWEEDQDTFSGEWLLELPAQEHWLDFLHNQLERELTLLERWTVQTYAQVDWDALVSASRVRLEQRNRLSRNHVLTWRDWTEADVQQALNDPETSTEHFLELRHLLNSDHLERLYNHPACNEQVMVAMCERFSGKSNSGESQAVFWLLNHPFTPLEGLYALLNASWWDWVHLDAARCALERPDLPSCLRRALEVMLEVHTRPNPPILPGPHNRVEALLGISDRPDPNLPPDLEPLVLAELSRLGCWAARAVLRYDGVPLGVVRSLLGHGETQVVLDAVRYPGHADAQLLTWIWNPLVDACPMDSSDSPLVQQVLLERFVDHLLVHRTHNVGIEWSFPDQGTWNLGLYAALELCAELARRPLSRPEALAWVASVRRDLCHTFSRLNDPRREAVQDWENQALFGDKQPSNLYILAEVLRHPKTPPELLELFLLEDDDWSGYAEKVVQNPALPSKLALHLSESHSSALLCTLAGHLATPKAVLEQLARDESLEVREAALKSLQQRFS